MKEHLGADDRLAAGAGLIDQSTMSRAPQLSDEAPSNSVPQLQNRIEQLEREVATLQQAVATRQLTGQATGLLAAWLHVGTTEAWQVLRRLSNNTNMRARDVARLLVASADGPIADLDDQKMLRVIVEAIDTINERRTMVSTLTSAPASHPGTTGPSHL